MPATDKTSDGAVTPRPCRNCGKPAGPRYCGHCGQEVDDHRRPLAGVLGDVLAEWFTIDGQLPRTLATLARPGRLTRLYREGKRAAFVPPMRLYMLASVLLFASAFNFPTTFDATNMQVSVGGEIINPLPDAQGGSRATLDLLSPDNAMSGYIMRRYPDELARLKQRPPQDIVDEFIDGARQLLPLAFIIFLPFLALGLKVLYFRSGTLYVDHLVFAVHFQAAWFLAFAVIWLVVTTLRPFAGDVMIVVMILAYALTFAGFLFVFLPMALRHVHDQGRWWTALKTVLVVFVYLQLINVIIGSGAGYIAVTSAR